MLTQERLKELLSYDPETGVFIWAGNQFPKLTAKVSGNLRKDGYRRIAIDGKDYYAHRLAWLYVYGEFPSNQIDHINRIKDDNRIENLRDVTQNLNQWNRKNPRADNQTGYLGVTFCKKSGKYAARIAANKSYIHLGTFLNAEDASNAYFEHKKIIHAE